MSNLYGSVERGEVLTKSIFASAAAALLGAFGAGLLAASPARAAFTLNVVQDGDSVVATGSGSIDLTDLTDYHFGPYNDDDFVVPSEGYFILGTGADEYYGGFTGPSSFGTGTGTAPDSSTGDLVGINPYYPFMVVPYTYVSGDPLSDSAVWNDASLVSLGMTPGTYTWTWGSGADADSFAINISVPEPGSMALLVAGLLGLGIAVGGRRRVS
jgi:hypothetical protein